MNPKVISLGYAVPENSYTQEEIFEVLGYPPKYKKLFTESGIQKRHLVVTPEEGIGFDWQQQQERYLEEATALSERAIEQCLDGRDLSDGVGCLVYCSCTGIAPGPTIGHYLARRLNLPPHTYFTNISGQGCESGFPGLKRASDFVVTGGDWALVVNCELSSLSYFPELDRKPDPENHFEVLRSNAIFGDAASAALVGHDHNWRHPEILGTGSYTNLDFIDKLGYTWRGGRLRVLLSREVPVCAAKVVRPAVVDTLSRLHLRKQDINWWVIHVGGSVVLDNIRGELGLDESKMQLSRETLSLYGNTSSTSVGITGKRLMGRSIEPGELVAMLSVGPGMTGGCTVLRFGGGNN